MKTVKLITLLVLFSMHAGATGYSQNMFVAHKKLQARKESKRLNEHAILKKAHASKVPTKATPSEGCQPENSFTRQVANKLSGMVTLNQRVLEEAPASFFRAEDEQESGNTIASKLAVTVKGVVYAFVKSSSFGK
ncbi:hypothetical protein [Arcticibacter sp.]|uniref:hypothetical protein n=1 Tax=Arcticibacter sp. TaxID=1872630 RepID=UPI00388DD7DA